MPRLVAAAKGNYYPAHHNAVAVMAKYLRPPEDNAGFFIMDPCAGEGAAIAQLSQTLGCREEDTLAVELDELRAEELKRRLPAAQVLAPASFFGVFCTSGSLGLAYTNPPYADLGNREGRVEFAFLERVTGMLQTKGVLMWVVPAQVLDNYTHREHLLAHYHSLAAVTFPARHRKFKELVLFGVKRSKPIEPKVHEWRERCRMLDGDQEPPADVVYQIPSGTGPRTWCKTEPVESELLAALQRSPLNRMLESPGEMELASPPMSLGRGHVAMLLSAGQLDGIVKHPDDSHAHLIRGVAKKAQYVSSVHSEEDKNQTVTKTVMSEKIVMTVRALVHTGRIIELTQKGEVAK